jgi:hypothetical protein
VIHRRLVVQPLKHNGRRARIAGIHGIDLHI